MKILLNSYSGYGAWFLLRFIQEGHDVSYHFIDSEHDEGKLVLAGIVPEFSTKEPIYKNYDLSIFDLTGKPKEAEKSMLETPTIGDGDFNSEIEDDRLLGIEVMEQCDINVPAYEEFNDINEAKRFIRKTKKRYVFKPFGGQNQDTATTYVSRSDEDLIKYLDKLGSLSKGAEFILQEVVEGTEISTEAYFNGEEFYLVNATLEEKKFMEGNKGPNTGCSGNLVWIYNPINLPFIFREGLGKMKDFLHQYNYRGMIDLNTIVSDTKLYGLEWTPRFGYDASATLFNLISSNLGEFLGAVASGAKPEYETNNMFASGIRLSIPPYPSEIVGKHPEGIPIQGLEDDECVKDCFLYDCYLSKFDELCTAGINGFICVPISSGNNIEDAFAKVYEKIKRIRILIYNIEVILEKLQENVIIF